MKVEKGVQLQGVGQVPCPGPVQGPTKDAGAWGQQGRPGAAAGEVHQGYGFEALSGLILKHTEDLWATCKLFPHVWDTLRIRGHVIWVAFPFNTDSFLTLPLH